MINLKLLPTLTKPYLLERVSQEEIMLYYIGIPVNTQTLEGSSFLSPFRSENNPDKNPTCNYYYSENGKLRIKDWNGSFHGDIFDVASWATKINSKTSQGFKLLLNKIAYDFKVHKYSVDEERKKFNILYKQHITTKELKVFKVIPRPFNKFDGKTWYDRWEISSSLLKLGKVIPVQELQVEGNDGYLHTKYVYNSYNPGYAYYGGEINGIILWKVYFPLTKDKNKKFITNYSFIQGLNLLVPARVIVITKSFKDVLCFRVFGIVAICVPSETYVISKEIMFKLKSYADIVVTNFDYDKTGILLANKYKRVHNCYPIMFTRGRFNQPDFGVKDFTEFRETYGTEKTKALIINTFDKYKELFTYIDNLNKQAIKWIEPN
jgi:hypothetical protein